MGLGGALIWTGLARNLRREYPGKKIVFLYRKPGQRLLLGKGHPDHIIYKNNEDIACIVDHRLWRFKKWLYDTNRTVIVDMTNPDYFYHEAQAGERIVYKTGSHAIQIACDVHNISNVELRPKIRLTTREINNADDLLKAHHLEPDRFICVEPHAKKDFTPNKSWFWERWQEITDLINCYVSDNGIVCKLVQLGVANNKVLKGVVDLTGKTTFRETARILEKSITFVSYVGGLSHLAKAVGRKSVVLVSAWEPIELASYPNDINFYTDIKCKNCGLTTPCPIDRKCMGEISAEQVFEAVKSFLKDLS